MQEEKWNIPKGTRKLALGLRIAGGYSFLSDMLIKSFLCKLTVTCVLCNTPGYLGEHCRHCQFLSRTGQHEHTKLHLNTAHL